jgi:hypothetical protein
MKAFIDAMTRHGPDICSCMRELQNAVGILFFLLERLKTRGRLTVLVVPLTA